MPERRYENAEVAVLINLLSKKVDHRVA